jgi:copper transport protein
MLAPPASAHALLERATPSDGARVASAPHEIRLSFTEELSARFSVIRVLAPDGNLVEGIRVRGEGSTVVADLPELEKGTYTVLWRVVAEDDGHTTGGTMAFGIGGEPGPTGARTTGVVVSRAEVVLRWLDFSFFAGVVGAVLIGGFVVSRAASPAPAGVRERTLSRRRTLRAGCFLALGAVGCGFAVLVEHVARLSGTLVDASGTPGLVSALVLDTRWGRLWLAREAVLLLVAVLLLALVSTREGRRESIGLALVAAALSCVAIMHALGSHAAALDPSSPLAVVAEAAHVLAAAVWIGGVAALTLAVWPFCGLNRSASLALLRACRRPFAEIAGLSVGVVFATGLYSAGRQVATVDALLTTGYGHALLIKVGLVAITAALGATNFLLLRRLFRARHEDPGSGGPKLLLAELVAAAGVFFAAAVLASSVPARGYEFSAPRPAAAIVRTGSAADLVVSVTGTPARVGSNTFSAVIASSRRPPPAPIASLALTLRGVETPPRTIPLHRIELGRYVGTANLPERGRWRFGIIGRRAGQTFRIPFSLSVGRADPARPVRFSTQPLAPFVDWASALVFALTVAGAVWILAGRPRVALTPSSASLAEGVDG